LKDKGGQEYQKYQTAAAIIGLGYVMMRSGRFSGGTVYEWSYHPELQKEALPW
jgi:hypothetical protein